ncbi:MAG: hypothetical protein II767_13285, partial [Proteobacteria bacterium]|nr:hypothetical protein [Pseudomonadota bacterium]
RGVDYAPRRPTARLLSSESKHLITVLCKGSWISLTIDMWQLLKKRPFFSKKMHLCSTRNVIRISFALRSAKSGSAKLYFILKGLSVSRTVAELSRVAR